MFAGRSGGWLVLTQLDGVKLDASLELDAEGDKEFLEKLTALCAEVTAATARPEREIAYRAAWEFFNNCCSGCQTRADVERNWELDQSGEH